MAGKAIGVKLDAGSVAGDLAALGSDVAARQAKLERMLSDETIRRARAWAARIGRQQSRAADTLRPQPRGAGAVLPASPAWNVGAEFGSNRYRQFPRWRGSGSGAGYFLFPALGEVNMIKQSAELVAKMVREFNAG